MMQTLIQIADCLIQQKETLITAESLTGGLIAEVLTRQAGASRWFLGAFVVYTPWMKKRILNVDSALIEKYGVVSKECVCAMAQGSLTKSNASWALATSGIAGPGNFIENHIEKPEGLVWMAIAHQNGRLFDFKEHFKGNRECIRQQTADFILKKLLLILNNTI